MATEAVDPVPYTWGGPAAIRAGMDTSWMLGPDAVERDARGNALPTVYTDWARAVASAHRRATATGVRRRVRQWAGRWVIDVVEPRRYYYETFSNSAGIWAIVTDGHTGRRYEARGETRLDAFAAAFRAARRRPVRE